MTDSKCNDDMVRPLAPGDGTCRKIIVRELIRTVIHERRFYDHFDSGSALVVKQQINTLGNGYLQTKDWDYTQIQPADNELFRRCIPRRIRVKISRAFMDYVTTEMKNDRTFLETWEKCTTFLYYVEDWDELSSPKNNYPSTDSDED